MAKPKEPTRDKDKDKKKREGTQQRGRTPQEELREKSRRESKDVPARDMDEHQTPPK